MSDKLQYIMFTEGTEMYKEGRIRPPGIDAVKYSCLANLQVERAIICRSKEDHLGLD